MTTVVVELMARAVRAGAVHTVAAQGGDVIVWRDACLVPRAAWSACPHRGASLACAEVRNGELICPAHGWHFDGTGRNCRRPGTPADPRIRLQMLRTLEREGCLIVLSPNADGQALSSRGDRPTPPS